MQNCPAQKKLNWLRSNIIGVAGNHKEFDSPFGKRSVTYADSTATARCLHFVEDYIITNVLPFYGINSFSFFFNLVLSIDRLLPLSLLM